MKSYVGFLRRELILLKSEGRVENGGRLERKFQTEARICTRGCARRTRGHPRNERHPALLS